MRQQPFVAGRQPGILFVLRLVCGLFRVRALRQDDRNTEAVRGQLAGRIMERRAVDLDDCARRDAEGFDLRRVELAVFDLVFLCQE